MANFKNVVNKQEFIQVWMMIVHKCMSSYSFRILIIQRHMLITAIKGYWSHIKLFFVPYTYGQTHPSTSGIGAALQSRAGASVLQRLAQAIPKNLQVKKIVMISQHCLPSAGWWYGSSFDSLRVRLMLVSRVLHAGGASCEDNECI